MRQRIRLQGPNGDINHDVDRGGGPLGDPDVFILRMSRAAGALPIGWMEDSGRLQRETGRPPALKNRTCRHCGVAIHQRGLRNNRLYCDPFCQNEGRNAQKRDQRPKEAPRTCPIDGVRFNPARKGTIYCSRRCRYRAARLR